jgi:polyisoprenoid-binding protein YceI
MARSGRKWLLITVVPLAVLAIAGTAIWYFMFRDTAPEAANIDDASRTLDELGDGGDLTADDLVGEWQVDGSVGSFEDFSGTWAGYRFDEELASIGATTAAGRTPGVTGTMSVSEDEVTGVEIEVDMTTLESDKPFRDDAIRTRGLESNEFPTGSFVLSGPIEFPDGVADGESVQATATGELTLHGVTKQVTIDMEAQIEGDHAVVVGSSPVALTDFGIEPPTNAQVLSVANDGEFEFQVFFSKS